MGKIRLPAPKGTPLAIAVLYTVAGSLWIYFSGNLVSDLLDSPAQIQKVELAKGLAFVVATGCLLYFLLRNRPAPAATLPGTATIGRGYGFLAVILLLILLVPVFGFLVNRLHVPQAERQTLANLKSIADHQITNLRLWADERVRDANAVRNSKVFLTHLAQLQDQGPDTGRALLAIRDRLETVRDAYQYEAIFLLDSAGEQIIRVGNGDAGLSESLLKVLPDVASPQGLRVLSQVGFEAPDGYHIDFVAAIGEQINRGFLVLRTRPDHFLLAARDVPTPYQTLQAHLLHRVDDGFVALRINPPATGKSRLFHVGTEDNTLLAHLASDPDGAGEGTFVDANGAAFYGVYQPFHKHGWSMVARVNRDEALLPGQRQAAWITLLSFLTLTSISIMLLILWRQQRRNYDLFLVAATAEHEHALLEQERVYRELFKANPHPMWVYDGESLRFLAINEAAVRQYGYSREEFLAMTIGDIRPPEDVDRLLDHIDAQGPDPVDEAGVWRHRRKDGSEIAVEISSHRLEFDGRPAELVVAYDITERLQAARQLTESERFARSTLDALALNIAVLDGEGLIIATNDQWRAFSRHNNGAEDSTGVGANYLEVCRQSAAQNPEANAMAQGLEDVLAGRSHSFHLEYPCHGPDEERWFRADVVRFRDDGPVRVVVSHDDITQRKRAELELLKLNRYYAALSAMNNAIIRAEDPEAMLRQVCDIAVQHTELVLVTINKVEGDLLIPGYIRSGPEAGLSDRIRHYADGDMRTSRGIVAQAARDRATVVVNNVGTDPRTRDWYLELLEERIHAFAACPIQGRNQLWGVISFCAKQPDYFTPDLVKLLEELTADLAFSLDSLESERLRDAAESRLLLNARIIESTHEGLFITDVDNRITMVNQAMTEITGYSRDELIGQTPAMLSSGQQSADFYRQLWLALETTGRWQGEIWDRRRNGDIFPAWLAITRVEDENQDGHHHIALYRDITERKEYERRIEHLATHDMLTNLPNRVLLEQRASIAIALAKRHDQGLAALFIDLDNFKLINDTLGHDTGDTLLKAVAQRIVAVLRESDTVCRVGGDEFVALVPDIHSPTDAAVVAEKIIREVSRPLVVGEHNLIITASVGIALFPENGDDLEGLARLADIAMMSAKQGGHNRYRFYSGEMGESSSQYLHMLNELRHAIGRQQLHLAYQPQVELATGRIVGAECLVRWRHPELGDVPPGRFIPIAEDSGLIIELGAWILGQACQQAEAWRQRGLTDFPVSVNVSALQFRQIDFVEHVQQALRDSGLPGSCLELEVTESLLMNDLDEVLRKLERLEALGVVIAIDDFGTGYSSLSYLRQFSAHRLKIDKSFIRDLPDDPDARAIVNAVIRMGSSLGMDIIAEGVETPAQSDYLSASGCRHGQGFLFSVPLPPGELEALLAKQ